MPSPFSGAIESSPSTRTLRSARDTVVCDEIPTAIGILAKHSCGRVAGNLISVTTRSFGQSHAGAIFTALITSEVSRVGREQIETPYALKQLSVAGVRCFRNRR
jgi:hypothetical protein